LLLAFIAARPLRASAETLNVEMYPLTGEIRFANATAAAFPFIYYSINSSPSTLNSSPTVWKSITDTYDVSGNGFIDPLNNWTKLAATSSALTESVFLDPGGTLAPFRAVSLGEVWNAPSVPNTSNLTFQVLESDYGFSTISARLAVDGDYNWDGTVNSADYTKWKQHIGESSTLGALQADGNLNGIVDAADYTIWRNNVGLSLIAVGSGAGSDDSVAFTPFRHRQLHSRTHQPRPRIGLGEHAGVPAAPPGVRLLRLSSRVDGPTFRMRPFHGKKFAFHIPPLILTGNFHPAAD
jgi:hypothetical protein